MFARRERRVSTGVGVPLPSDCVCCFMFRVLLHVPCVRVQRSTDI